MLILCLSFKSFANLLKMEPYRQRILGKITGGRPEHELAYFEQLFQTAGNGASELAGPVVVTFFKRSNLEMVRHLYDSYFLLTYVIVSTDYTEGDLAIIKRVKKQESVERGVLHLHGLRYVRSKLQKACLACAQVDVLGTMRVL